MTDRQAFLRAIAAQPNDDMPRRIYADYLDEHGDWQRADLIRRMTENPEWIITAETATTPNGARRRWPLYVKYWAVNIPGPFRRAGMTRYIRSLLPSLKDFAASVVFHRGFIDEMMLLSESWLAHGKYVLQSEPIRRVKLVSVSWQMCNIEVIDGVIVQSYCLTRNVAVPAEMNTADDLEPYMQYHAAEMAKWPRDHFRPGDKQVDVVRRLLAAEFGDRVEFDLPMYGLPQPPLQEVVSA